MYIRILIVHYSAKNPKNQDWVFRYDYLKYINGGAIAQIMQNRSIIVV